ncbi:MAG: type II toxin-antitoxin system HicB family antitoxin [Candidatus Woesebacteria bacterium]|nr:type II toxin-antitoxin system HicB family antitoxin [Candidatus Woesebacteria bacterium]
MKIKNYSVILKKEPEGGYTAIVPSLPGCVTYGESIEKAQEMVKDAIESYMISFLKHGEEIPEERNVFLTSISVQSSGVFFAHA